MIEQKCLLLELMAGKPKGTDIPATPPTRATATCYARTYEECPKGRNKLEITTMCFRLRGHRIAELESQIDKEMMEERVTDAEQSAG